MHKLNQGTKAIDLVWGCFDQSLGKLTMQPPQAQACSPSIKEGLPCCRPCSSLVTTMRTPILLPVLLILSLSSLVPSSVSCPTCPTPKPPPPPPPPKVKPCPPPPPPKPNPCPPPPKTPTSSCPIDILKLSACVDVLGGLVHAAIGEEATSKCCPVISGLSDLDAALCLCTTIKAKLLNVNVLLPIALELLIDCGKHAPSGYQCPA